MDPLIKSQLLYQLSYMPVVPAALRGVPGRADIYAAPLCGTSAFWSAQRRRQDSTSTPARPTRTSRWIEALISSPKLIITVSITVPP